MTSIDQHRPQYAPDSIHRYEQIFGRNYVSTGGAETTREIASGLGLKAGMDVLDVGCGLGGSAFMMAQEYGARVTGVDLLPQMIDLAKERAAGYGIAGVEFVEGDILALSLPEGKFDLVYSRDAFLHIPNKATLFSRLLRSLKPGGKVFLTDYASGPKPWTEAFSEYQTCNGYDLRTPEAYAAVVQEAGFTDVKASDRTEAFVAVLRRERYAAQHATETGPEALSAEDRAYLVDRWTKKIAYCETGDMRWVHLEGRCPP